MNNFDRLALTAYRFRAREYVNRVVVDRMAKINEYVSGEQSWERRERLRLEYALVLREVLREIADDLEEELTNGGAAKPPTVETP